MFPDGLFSRPIISEVAFWYSNSINITSFGNSFTWDNINVSQITFSCTNSKICSQLNRHYEHLENYPQVSSFIEETGACNEVCDSSSGQKLACTPFMYQDGVCNPECNVAACKYDEFDCNQLCPIYSPDCFSTGLFANQVCDSACNTSFCNYDKYDCLNNDMVIDFPQNVTYCNAVNISSNNNYNYDNYNNTESLYADLIDTYSLCDKEWVGDKWCDGNCMVSDACYKDEDDCKCDEVDKTNCDQIVEWFLLILAENTDDLHHISLNGIKTLWYFIDNFNWQPDDDFGETPAIGICSVHCRCWVLFRATKCNTCISTI